MSLLPTRVVAQASWVMPGLTMLSAVKTDVPASPRERNQASKPDE